MGIYRNGIPDILDRNITKGDKHRIKNVRSELGETHTVEEIHHQKQWKEHT